MTEQTQQTEQQTQPRLCRSDWTVPPPDPHGNLLGEGAQDAVNRVFDFDEEDADDE